MLDCGKIVLTPRSPAATPLDSSIPADSRASSASRGSFRAFRSSADDAASRERLRRHVRLQLSRQDHPRVIIQHRNQVIPAPARHEKVARITLPPLERGTDFTSNALGQRGIRSASVTAWPCALTKSYSDSHRWRTRCERPRMLVKLRGRALT
jgi:hypothetical protein